MKDTPYIYRRWPRIDWRELMPNNPQALVQIFSSLHARNFRLYFIGQCVSLCGSWIQNIALSWLVYSLTHSIFLLSMVSFLNLIPSLLLTPFAGVISDRFNRYRILLCTQTLFMVQAIALASLTLSGVIQVWHILLISTIAGIVSSVEAPARQSFYTKLVSPSDLSNAIALNSVAINASRFVGPTIGGIVISLVGEGYCFLLNAVSYTAVLAALMTMTLPAYVNRVTKIDLWRDLRQGVLYVNQSLPLKTILTLLAVVSFFGLPFITIVPALVKDVLGGGSNELGYVMSSVGAGSMTAALYLASRKQVVGLGRVVTISTAMFGAGLVALSFIYSIWVVCLICFPIGFGMISIAASSNTLLQTLVQDRMRGRVMSFFTMAFAGCSPLGSLFVGSIAPSVGLTRVLLGSGCVCLLAAGVYEYYRPQVRQAVQERHPAEGTLTATALGMEDSTVNPF